ncbi:hypothetical protein LLG96_17165 [bacterium]|nr:hypothetical protein [bacterium]
MKTGTRHKAQGERERQAKGIRHKAQGERIKTGKRHKAQGEKIMTGTEGQRDKETKGKQGQGDKGTEALRRKKLQYYAVFPESLIGEPVFFKHKNTCGVIKKGDERESLMPCALCPYQQTSL